MERIFKGNDPVAILPLFLPSIFPRKFDSRLICLRSGIAKKDFGVPGLAAQPFCQQNIRQSVK